MIEMGKEVKDRIVMRYTLDNTKDIRFSLQGFGFGNDFDNLINNDEYQRILTAYQEFTKNVFGHDLLEGKISTGEK